MGSVPIFRKEANQRPRVAGQRVQSQAVLEFTEVESRRLHQPRRDPINLGKDLEQVEEDLDRRREPDTRRAGQITVVAPVGAETVG